MNVMLKGTCLLGSGIESTQSNSKAARKQKTGEFCSIRSARELKTAYQREERRFGGLGGGEFQKIKQGVRSAAWKVS